MVKCSNISFSGHIRVRFYAQHPEHGYFVPIVKKENIKKCQNFVVRNLNETLKNPNRNFINDYKKIDKDYAECKCVRSVYDSYDQSPHLITGKDVGYLEEIGKKLGIAKSDAFERTGKRNSLEEKRAQNEYYQELQDFLTNCKKVKNENGEELLLNVFFQPIYNTKKALKNFKYLGTIAQNLNKK